MWGWGICLWREGGHLKHASSHLQDEELGSYLTSLLKKGLPQAPS